MSQLRSKQQFFVTTTGEYCHEVQGIHTNIPQQK